MATRRQLALVVALHVLPFAARPTLIGGDEPHYALMAHSIAVDRDLSLDDDYREVAQGSSAAGRRRAGTVLDPHLLDRGGTAKFAHPLGLPLLASPLLWVVQTVAPGAPPDLPLGIFGLAVTFCALLMGRDLLRSVAGDQGASAVAVSVYFTTPIWYYSRTFFTEPFVWSFAVLALWLLKRGWWTAGGVALACTLALKETSLLIVVPLLLYVLVHSGPLRFAKAALGTVVFALAFLSWNLYSWGEPFVTFQPFRRGSFLEGAFGLLLSPEHGLLFFAPLVLLAPLCFVGRGGDAATVRAPAGFAAMVFLGYFLTAALWLDWGGGSSYGPRLLLPGIAALAVPLASVWRRIRAHRAWLWAWAVLSIAGFTIQWCAAIEPRAALWSPAVFELLSRHPLGALAGLGLGVVLWICVVASAPVLAPAAAPVVQQ